MTTPPVHVDLHRLADRLDPDQVHALRAAAQQLPRHGGDRPGYSEEPP